MPSDLQDDADFVRVVEGLRVVAEEVHVMRNELRVVSLSLTGDGDKRGLRERVSELEYTVRMYNRIVWACLSAIGLQVLTGIGVFMQWVFNRIMHP